MSTSTSEEVLIHERIPQHAAKSTAAPVRTIVPPAMEEPEPSTSMSTETPVFNAVTSPNQPKEKNTYGASFYRTTGTKTRQLQTSA